MMTREEAKKVFLNRGYIKVEGGTIFDANKWREACSVISKWLEEEPCRDAVSRAAVFREIINEPSCVMTLFDDDEDVISQQNIIEKLKNLPSVRPTEKVGEWVYDAEIDKTTGHCTICGHYARYGAKTKWCPDCGAKMKGDY